MLMRRKQAPARSPTSFRTEADFETGYWRAQIDAKTYVGAAPTISN
jgi:hypothetical protein